MPKTNQPASLDFARNGVWWATIAADLVEKAALGFQVSAGDIYGRVLGYHFVNGTTRSNFFDANAPHGLGETLSSLSTVMFVLILKLMIKMGHMD